MICMCSLAGTEACKNCLVYKSYYPDYPEYYYPEYSLPYNIEGMLIYPKEYNMITKICGTCEWYKDGLCVFNPQIVEKKSMDVCSHWTAKTLNEVKND